MPDNEICQNLFSDIILLLISSVNSTSLTAEDLAGLAAKGNLEEHYSSRYACAYLTGLTEDKKPLIAWYLNPRSVEERVRFAKLFSVDQLVVDDLRQMAAVQSAAAPEA